MAALSQTMPQETAVAEIIAAVTLPKGVHLQRIYFDSDHAGYPAIRIVFGVSKRIALSAARVHDLAAFRRSVRDAVLARGFDPFPYVTLQDAR